MSLYAYAAAIGNGDLSSGIAVESDVPNDNINNNDKQPMDVQQQEQQQEHPGDQAPSSSSSSSSDNDNDFLARATRRSRPDGGGDRNDDVAIPTRVEANYRG